MRYTYLLLLATMLCSSTTLPSFDNYDKMWKTVHDMENKGLIRSALAEVEKIYSKSKSDDNYPNWVQSYIYINKYTAQIEEEGEAKVLLRFESDIPSTPEPVKSILHHYAGQYFYQYLRNNQYKLNQRTELLIENNEDVRTWSVDRLEKRARYHLLKALENKDLIYSNASDYSSLFSNKFKVKWDVSLYDQLLFGSLQFFENNSIQHKPVNRFEINSKAIFNNAEDFSKQAMSAVDTTDYNYLALKLYQNWLEVHLKEDKKALALINAKRLSFANKLTGDSEKYLSALESAPALSGETSCVYDYYIAQYYVALGSRYSVTREDEHRVALKKAYEITESCTKCTILDNACEELLKSLKESSNSLSISQVNQIDKPIPIQIYFKNIDKLYYHIYKLNEQTWFDNYHDQNGHIKIPNGAIHIRTEEIHLIDEQDFQGHSFKMNLAPLSSGQYFMLVTRQSTIPKKVAGQQISIAKFQVSDMALLNRGLSGRQEFYIVNREKGNPLDNVSVEYYNRLAYPATGLTDLIKSKNTDKNGRFFDELGDANPIKRRRQQQQIFILKNGNDKLIVDRNYYINNHSGRPRNHDWTQFFTDRAIYRPGQSIHFKGIQLRRNGDRINTIIPNVEVLVTLRDVNNQEVAKGTFKTNEYGSFNGSFLLPTGSLNGAFTLRTSGSSHQVQVEEYKRPTFEAVFDTLKGDYVLGEEIKLSGIAKNLAGNVLQNAKGSYRITRSTYFPYGFDDHYFRVCYPHFQTNEEIANGELAVNNDGTFNIAFNSVKDLLINKSYSPINNYKIFITIIDENGESHDFAENITVGPTAVKVEIEHPEKIDLSADAKISLVCTNYNGQPKSVPGAFSIRRLKEPTDYIVDRNWAKPDIIIEDISKPDPKWSYYNDPTDMTKWESIQLVTRQKMLINEKVVVDLKKYKLKPGKYAVMFVGKDTYGQEVKSLRYIDVFDGNKKNISDYQHHYISWDDKDYEPGEEVKVDIYSANDIWILVDEIRKNESSDAKWLKVNGKKTLSFEVKETDRGNFFINALIVSKGKLFKKNLNVKVPWSNKDLKIEYLSFRDKLIPGQKEKWIIKLSGSKKDAVAAEMVAALYDASLDAFKNHSWSVNFHPTNYNSIHWGAYGFDGLRGHYNYVNSYTREFIDMPIWNLFDLMNSYGRGGGRRVMMRNAPQASMMMDDGAAAESSNESSKSRSMDAVEINDTDVLPVDPGPTVPLVRSNLQETVFFFPELKTDNEGNVIIEFEMGEALTKWKLLTFGHTKDLKFGIDSKEIITQKDFMVFPLFPRFFREFDKMTINSKVVNMTGTSQTIDVKLNLQDGLTKIDKTKLFQIQNNNLKIDLGPNESKTVSWEITIPAISEISAVTAQVIATSGVLSDGEEHLIPVLTNRKLVTEAISMPLKSLETKEWNLSDLRELMNSNTAKLENVALEVSSNPAWYAVLALPYLEEQVYESTSAKMSRYYANRLASYVIEQNPKIKDVFNDWKIKDDQGKGNDDFNAFMSHLEKNQELKYVVINQTPWVSRAKNEEDQRRRIALLFDMNKLANEQSIAWNAVKSAQNSDGGYSWMPGGRSNWHTTIQILSDLAHLIELKAIDVQKERGVLELIQKAIRYSDNNLKDYLRRLKRNSNWSSRKNKDDFLSSTVIYHLYVRSQFDQLVAKGGEYEEAHHYFLNQMEKFWPDKNIYAQGLIALSLDHYNMKKELPIIIQSLKERSLEHEELGRYWKYDRGYNWYQRPIETQSLMMQVFNELSDDTEMVEAMKIWLLKHKQTNHWKSSRATSEAVFALLSSGPSLLEMNDLVKIEFAGKELVPEKVQAGTGYFKKSWNKGNISEELTNIKLSNPNDNIAYGGIFWQYFEDLDKIKSFEKTPLTINKTIAKQIMTDQGPKLISVKKDDRLSIGDRVVIRIEIRVDREMEYVHLQDMRSSGLEPTQVISGYRWQDGLGYYQTIKDASADFFIDYLPKGTFVFEYPLKVSHAGDFSNGITTIQSYYAPEFTSHSKGDRVVVD